MQIIHIPYCLDHILGYTTLKIVGPTYIVCKLKVLIVFFQGHVLSDGEPIQDVGFLLFSKSVTQKVWKVNLLRTWLVYIMISSSLAYSLFPGLWD